MLVSFTFVSGSLVNGLMLLLMTGCLLKEVNSSTQRVKVKMSSGVHYWRKLMPSKGI